MSAGGEAPAGAGRETQDAANNAKLLRLLKDEEDRAAHYYAAIVLVRHADDPEPLVADGQWQGRIIDTPRGENGFGYDPIFVADGYTKTFAELTIEEKSVISHRGLAVKQLVAFLSK